MEFFFNNSGEHSYHTGYCPINLLPIFGKVLDALINAELVKHLSSHDLVSDKEYGFRFSRSTAYVLPNITEFVSQVLDKNDQLRDVARDISKAFDKVWYVGFLYKLSVYGVYHLEVQNRGTRMNFQLYRSKVEKIILRYGKTSCILIKSLLKKK